MTILEATLDRIQKCSNLIKLDANPNSERFDFISDIETVELQKLQENRIWYVGDSNELQNYYTNRGISGNAKEPIYNRNKPQYFWGVAVGEDFKKVHSGVPHAIVKTISDIIGMPVITSEKYQKSIDKLLKDNDFTHLLTEAARPFTCVEGYGAWKPIINQFSKSVQWEYYEGEYVKFAYKGGKLIGIIYQDFYEYQSKKYVLLETRRVGNDELGVKSGSIIEWELYLLSKGNGEKTDIHRVPLDTIPELSDLDENGLFFEGVGIPLGVACKYFYDINNKKYGRSIFTGKLDIFDDIDQCLSQASQTDRVSTPVEYYPVDMLERGKYGDIELPKVFNRQFLKKETIPNGDGKSNDDITTTQPELNFEQYTNRYNALINVALIGTLSPATLGFDIAKKDNAEAQREKEKVSIHTTNSIKDGETRQIKDLIRISIMLQSWIDRKGNSFDIIGDDFDKDISIKYSDFAAPSEVTVMKELLPAFNAGAISDELFVEKVYGDSLSDEEKEKEVEAIKGKREADNLEMGDFGLEDEESIRKDNKPEAKPEERVKDTQE